MPLLHYRVPKNARHAALGRMNGYGLENQSRGRDWFSRGRSTTALTGTGISEPSLFNARRNVRSVARTILPRIRRSDLLLFSHCLSMQRWTLNRCMAIIWANLAEFLRLS